MKDETPLFFENRTNHRLFGILHKAVDEGSAFINGTAIIYCHPLFEEKLLSHRVMVNFARYATGQGFHVFRFDYFGDGESEGLFEEASISSRVSDIISAVTFIKKTLDPKNILLLGLGMGATLALFAANKCKLIDGIITWSPIVKGRKYIYDMLRINLSSQMVVHKKVVYDRNTLVHKINDGESVNVDGYEITNPFFDEISSIDLENRNQQLNKRIFLVQISPYLRPEKPLQGFLHAHKNEITDYKIVKEIKFWMQQKIVYPPCEELFSITTDWSKNTII